MISLPTYRTSVVNSPITPLSIYRTVSLSPPIYETIRTYLTVTDLYMRYTPLKSAKSLLIPRFRTVLPIMTVKDLYEKFHGKEREKSVTPTPKKTPNSRTNQITSYFKCSDLATKTSFFDVQKPIPQRSNTPHRRYTKTTKHTPLVQVSTNNVRHDGISPFDLAVDAVSPTQLQMYEIPRRRPFRKATKDPDMLI